MAAEDFISKPQDILSSHLRLIPTPSCCDKNDSEKTELRSNFNRWYRPETGFCNANYVDMRASIAHHKF